MAWTATHRFARISARKVRPVADMIRGRNVDEALNILKFTPNRAAYLVRKALTSAVANADEAEADVELLYVDKAFVDQAASIRRFREKDRGRVHWFRKRNSHITIVVEERRGSE
jgi:large subunit ribosomal protein L22